MSGPPAPRPPGRRTIPWNTLLLLVGVSVGLGVLSHRLRGRSPEQGDLRRYVEVETPALRRLEEPLFAALDRLAAVPGPKPEEARALLADDLIPRLLKLRKAAQAVRVETAEVARLHAEYGRALDAVLDACRHAVQVIDAPSLTTADAVREVRTRFATAKGAYAGWQAHVREACVFHRLAAP